MEARPYQVEIVEKVLKQNCIVCLGTGTGKTFIAAMVIRELYDGKRLSEGKRIFFCVNTVPLVAQQSQVLETHTSLSVGQYWGDLGVDFWDKLKWREELDKHDVLVMTGQILCDLLNLSKIKSDQIGLLVMDECHNATKNHAYNQILKYLADENQNKPHILGLTASIINTKWKGNTNSHSIRTFLEKQMKDLESRMNAVLTTCSDRDAMKTYATQPKEFVQPFSLQLRNDSVVEGLEVFFESWHEKLNELIRITG